MKILSFKDSVDGVSFAEIYFAADSRERITGFIRTEYLEVLNCDNIRGYLF